MYESSPENVLLQAERFRILAQALERMPLKRRRLVLLHRFEGLSYAEIGEQFGMSAENVRKHIERTLEYTDWNKSQAAAILNIERSTLDRKIKTYEITKDPTSEIKVAL